MLNLYSMNCWSVLLWGTGEVFLFLLLHRCFKKQILFSEKMSFLFYKYFDAAHTYIDIDDGCRNAASAKSIIIENREYRAKHNSTGQHRFLTYKIGRIFIHNENIVTLIKCHRITSKSESPTENIFSPFLKVGSIIYNKVRKSKNTHMTCTSHATIHTICYILNNLQYQQETK